MRDSTGAKCSGSMMSLRQLTAKANRVGIIGEDYRRFIRQLGRAKKVQIEATFFNQGTHIFEFDVSQLRKDW
jgi:hypothetical protein